MHFFFYVELVEKESIAIQTELPAKMDVSIQFDNTLDNMKLRMLSAKTLEIENLRKELLICKEEQLKYKTEHSHAMKPVVQLG